ncbi:MAG: GspH/FimT family pseudopilin [Desulfuromonadales bacterium]|nr:GspH/FimT family pseudopilin [Desulfuromonadales bacterium]
MNKTTARQGFTLLELLIVLAIMAILTAIATPGWLEWRRSAEFRTAVREAHACYHRARAEAVHRNTSVALRFTAGTGAAGRIEVFVDDGAGGGTEDNYQREGDEEMIVDFRLPPAIILAQTNFVGQATAFKPSGLSKRQGSACFTDGPRTLNLTLSQAGFVRLESVPSCP